MHLPTGLVYNGVNPTIEAFQTPETVQHLPTLDRKKIPIELESNTGKG